jgi:DNA-binding MarR family transcriptional regulator
MSTLDRRAVELRNVVQEILNQFQFVNAEVANGPHVDLSCQELRLVEHIGDDGPKIMRELAGFLLLAVNSVTSIVDNLETKGIVRRHRSEEDRRIVRVELTEHGRAVYVAAVDQKTRFLRAMLAELNEEEQEIYMLLMRKIARAGQSQVLKMQTRKKAEPDAPRKVRRAGGGS